MNEEQFWISVWKIIAAVVVLLVASMASCTAHRDRLKYEAIKAGADPMVLACAAGVREGEQHICTLLAQRGAAK